MKIVFLDMDGVMNNSKTLREHMAACIASKSGDELAAVSPRMVAELNRIVEKTGARVVLSSTWRLPFCFGQEKTLKRLRESGLDPKIDFLGVTDEFYSWHPDEDRRIIEELKLKHVKNDRVVEIWSYLTKKLPAAEKIESFVILDDMAFFQPLSQVHVQTNMLHGLTPEKADQAIEILSRPYSEMLRKDLVEVLDQRNKAV